MPMMDDALRHIDPGSFEPVPPARPQPLSGPLWVIGPLVLSLLGYLLADAVVLSLGVVLLAILLVYSLKRKLAYCHAFHLYALKMTSFQISRAPLLATEPPTPDFRQLDAHFPAAAAVHRSAWTLRTQPGLGGDRPAPTDYDRALWSEARPALARVRNAEVLPRTCYRCRRWIWLYRVLAKLPDRA